MNRPRTAWIVGPGRYVLVRHELRRVPANKLAISCELCEWSVFVDRDHDRAEALRREHLGQTHLSSLTAGAAVLDPELAS